MKKAKSGKHHKIHHKITLTAPFGFIVNNPLVALVTSFVVSVMLDPVAITFLSKSWEGTKTQRFYNGFLGFLVGTLVWVSVWIGTKHAEPILYAPAWGVFYLLAAIIVPLILTNGWKEVTASMWFFLAAGVLSFSCFIYIAVNQGFFHK